jgi:phosphoribosylaminoimidazole-succinocarboxamide synthase
MPQQVDLLALNEPLYRGSVQNLHAFPGHPGFMLCQTTESGSVFDVGSIFTIEGNDLNRALFRHAAYQRLAQPQTWVRVEQAIAQSDLPADWRQMLMGGVLSSLKKTGAQTHHVGMVDAQSGAVCPTGLPQHPSCWNVVRRFPVMHPPQRRLMGHHVYDYGQFHQNSTYVIPLEYIVRFGLTTGSSVMRKYQSLGEHERAQYAQELGVEGELQPWQMLPRPIFDFTSKYEPEDRAVSKQEALLMSGLGAEAFDASIQMALLGAWALREMLEQAGLQLWDLKWEFAVDGDDLLFVDTIDADSFRATATLPVDGRQAVVHYNKQAMRDYYRLLCPEWYAGINRAKLEAARTGEPFKQVLRDGQQAGRYPATPEVAVEFLQVQAGKTACLRKLIEGSVPADEVCAQLRQLGLAEVDFYRRNSALEAWLKLNAVD